MRRKSNVLRKRILFIIIFVLAVEFILGALVLFFIPDRYDATVTVMSSVHGGALSSEGYDLNKKLLEDFRVLSQSETVLQKAIQKSGISITVDALRRCSNVSSYKNTSLLSITVWTGKADTCATLANAMAQALIEEVSDISSLQVADPARPATGPARMQAALILGIGFVLSLILACTIALLMDYFDDTIRSTEQASSLFGRPVLGQIPHGVTRLRKR